jgi:hypothetical protein
MTHDEIIQVVQAHKEGKVIEFKNRHSGVTNWWPVKARPIWNFNALAYRVKPEPKEYWLVPYKNTTGLTVFYTDPGSLPAGFMIPGCEFTAGLDFANTIHVVTVVKDGEIT